MRGAAIVSLFSVALSQSQPIGLPLDGLSSEPGDLDPSQYRADADVKEVTCILGLGVKDLSGDYQFFHKTNRGKWA